MNRSSLFLFSSLTLLVSLSALSTKFETKYSHTNKTSAISQYIVVLKNPSIYQQLKINPASPRVNQQKAHYKQIESAIDLQQRILLDSIQSKFKGEVTVNRQFKKLLNAVVITSSPAQLLKISSMPLVKRIDKVIHHKTTTTKNVTNIEVIKADLVWSKEIDGVAITGKGINVAVLDTGIDYNHPDLGGCFGADCKVYGGYDFINEDDDPLDDDSHGTHVAGIIAANGTLKGVAPDARLLAVKVCNEYGNCPTSTIIEGLEFALDPDGDPETDDRIDVINMSLGSSSHDNALLEAVNNIVEQGVVVVVSAGNDGPSKNVIGSPADAEKAITVAASSGATSIATFSSRGFPSSGSPLLKPEVTAPGVSINSTLPAGEYGQLSGTSMASPMVAGVVALMKQYAPIKTPAQIKAALIATASPIVNDIQIEGAGLIDALAAINLPINIDTPVISFGDSDFSQELFEVTVPFIINNPSDEEFSFDLNIGEASHSSITYQSMQSAVTIEAGESLAIDITMSVDINELPISEESPSYNTPINFDIDGQTYHIPMVLFHRSYIDVNFGVYSQNYADLVFFNEQKTIQLNLWSPESLSGQTKRIFITPGSYNLVDSASNDNSSPLRETAFLFYPNLTLENTLSIEVSTEHAIHKVHFDIENPFADKISNDVGLIKDQQNGVRLAMYNQSTGQFIKNNYLPFSLNEGQHATFSFTDIPENYTFHLFSENDNEEMTINTSFSKTFHSPITQDVAVEVKAGDYKKVTLSYAQPSWLTTPYLLPFIFQKFNLGEETSSGTAGHYAFDEITQGRSYYSTGMDDKFQFSYFSTQINNKEWTEEGHEELYFSPNFKINKNNQLALYNFYNDQVLKVFEESENYQLTVGKLLPFWAGVVSKQDNEQFVYNFTDNQSNAFFRDSHYSYWKEQVMITTNNIENSVNNNYISMNWSGSTQNIDLPIQSGLIETELSFVGYIIEDKQSHISTHLSFDLDKEHYSPPVIRDLQVTTFNKSTHQLQCGQGAISIAFNENITNEKFKLSIRKSDESEWLQQETINQENKLTVEFSDVLAGFYDLKFTATNSGGNTLSYTAEPAFHVKEYSKTENDDDCDDISNIDDAFPLDPNEWLDTDNDGIGNNADTDDDNDGIEDIDDAFPLNATESVDTDNDGIGNNTDTDDDGDGVDDNNDAFPLDATESLDTDNDGIGNNADIDDDGDGVDDSTDAYPLDASRSSIPAPSVKKSTDSSGGGSVNILCLMMLIFIRVIAKRRISIGKSTHLKWSTK